MSRPILEADVRKDSTRKAKGEGLLHKRMAFMKGTANGWPDDLFIFPDGHHWWVEFKRPDGEATELQKERHEEIRSMNGDVSLIDSYELFQWELAQRMASYRDSLVYEKLVRG